MLTKPEVLTPKSGRWTGTDVQKALIEVGFPATEINVVEDLFAPSFTVSVVTGLRRCEPAPIGAVLRFGHLRTEVQAALQRLQLLPVQPQPSGASVHEFRDLYDSVVYVDSTHMDVINICSKYPRS